MKKEKYFTRNKKETLYIGIKLAKYLIASHVIYIQGLVGAGKTTLTRGIINGLGCYENVTSPTYKLVEIYNTNSITICHFDLYKITNYKELIEIDLNEYFNQNTITIVEWPENGFGILPNPNMIIDIKYQKNQLHMINITSNL